MKSLLFVTISSLFLFVPTSNKLKLICCQWRQIGIRSYQKQYMAIDSLSGEVITLSSDGTYKKLLYNSLKIDGHWEFCNDSTMLNFVVDGNMSLKESKPVDSIMKLTQDTLVYASIGYYGEKKIRGHDDWFFVRVK